MNISFNNQDRPRSVPHIRIAGISVRESEAPHTPRRSRLIPSRRCTWDTAETPCIRRVYRLTKVVSQGVFWSSERSTAYLSWRQSSSLTEAKATGMPRRV